MGTVPGCVWLGLPPPSAIIYQTLGGEPGLRSRSIFPGGRQECKVVSVTGDQRWNFAFATAAAGASGFIQTTASGSRARPSCGRAGVGAAAGAGLRKAAPDFACGCRGRLLAASAAADPSACTPRVRFCCFRCPRPRTPLPW